MTSLTDLKQELKSASSSERAKTSALFFKTGKGQYGQGDIFIGITVPKMREIAKGYQNLSFTNLSQLLGDKIHEYRLVALIILVSKFNKGTNLEKKEIYDFYLNNKKFVNNWDLVDASAEYIVGEYLLNREKDPIYKLAKSNILWDKRIAIVATFQFIKNNQFKDTFKIAKILMQDKHDLIHKAVGWMLREVGKRNQQQEEKFLNAYYKTMPRTTLRYAIERFEEKRRKFYMAK